MTSGSADDRGRDDFAARAGRLAVDLRLPHAVDLQDHLLDLARVHLLAGGVDQLARAAGEDDLAVAAISTRSSVMNVAVSNGSNVVASCR